MEWDEAARLLPGHGLKVDLSSSLYQWKPEHTAEVIHAFGVENVFYGTDYPMWDPAIELQRFMEVPLTPREREDIFWNNAASYFKL